MTYENVLKRMKRAFLICAANKTSFRIIVLFQLPVICLVALKILVSRKCSIFLFQGSIFISVLFNYNRLFICAKFLFLIHTLVNLTLSPAF